MTNPGVGSGLDGIADIANFVTAGQATSDSAQYNGRLDFNLRDSDRLAFAIYYVPQSSTFLNGPARGYNFFHHSQVNEAYSVIWNHTFSPTMMEAALAVRSYTSAEIKPLLDTQMKYSFLPQSVPAYSANQYFSKLRKKFPDYSYKEATLNPTNPINRATDWEADIVTAFRNSPERTEVIGERETPNGPMDRLQSLIGHYAPPNPQRIQSAMQAGNAKIEATAGQATLALNNYYKQGDKVSFVFDTAGKKLTNYNVDTYLDDPKKDVVTLTNDFASLPDGTNYLHETVLDAQGKEIEIKTTNSGHSLIPE